MKDRTYRYFHGQPLYTFGYGLSYTTFAYSAVKPRPPPSKQATPSPSKATVKNTGSVAGDEVVELYLTQPQSPETPIRILVGFKRVHLDPGQSTNVALTIDPRSAIPGRRQRQPHHPPRRIHHLPRRLPTQRHLHHPNRQIHHHRPNRTPQIVQNS